MNENKIRLAAILPESLVNGEGIRRVLFSQGCPHNCEGCFSPHTHSFEEGELVEMDEIIEKIKNNPILSGVTFSGGEPFEQAEKFAYIAKNVKELGLNVWSYTGYTYEYIIENQDKRQGWSQLLKYVDVLVDGKFQVDKQDSTLKFRGSTNQRIIKLKEKSDFLKE